MKNIPDYKNLVFEDISNVQFADIFETEELQNIQDLFADATGVASFISTPDGIPITRPSNFCRLCDNIIRKSEKGLSNCIKSDAAVGKPNPEGTTVQSCLSGGLWDAGVPIIVGGKHIANWLIGQVKIGKQDDEQLLRYADEIGVDRTEFMQAFEEVPEMSAKQFSNVAKMLSAFAKEISEKAYNNLQLKIHIAEREKATVLLGQSEARFRNLLQDVESVSVQGYGPDGTTQYWNEASERLYGYTAKEAIGRNLLDLIIPSEMRDGVSQAIQTMAETGQPIPASELLLKRKDGARIPVFSSHTIIQVPGREQELFCIDIDLRASKQAEEALRESEEKFRSITEQSHDFIAICDLTGVITYSSPVSVPFFQYSPEEMCGRNFTEFVIDSDDNTTLVAFLHGDGSDQNFKNLELSLKRKDGSVFIGELNETKYQNGRQVGALLVIHDISERKKAEENLYNERLLLRTLIDNIPDTIYSKDLHSRKTLANLSEVRFLGAKTEDEVLGKDDFDFYPKDVAARFHADDYTVLQSGKPIVNRDHYVIDETGQKRWFLSSKLPLMGKNNQVMGLVGISRDITDRRYTEEALRESEEKYRLIFDNSPLGLLSFDEKGILVTCNTSFAQIIGSSVEALTGLNMLELPDKTMVAAIQKALDGSKGLYEGVYHTVNSGKDIPGRALFAPMNVGDGRIRGGVGLIEDISERKRAEDALYESEEKYRLIFEHSPLGLLSFDRTGVIYACNESFAQIIGTPIKTLVGLNMLNLPDKKIVSAIRKTLEGSTGLYEGIYESATSQKTTPVRGLFAPMNTVYGQGGGVGIIEDITYRKQAEEELEERKEKYRGLSEATFEAIFLSEKGICIEQNLSAEKMFGYSSSEAIGRPGIEWIAVEDREMVETNILKGYEGSYEATAVRKDGSRFPCMLCGKMMYYKGRNVRSTSLTDISDRKKAEQALIESEEKYRAIFENVQDVFFQTDLSGIIREISPSIKHFTEFDRDKILGTPVSNLYFFPEERENLIAKIMKSGELRDYELRIKTVTGELKYVSINARLISNADGKFTHIDGALRDITDRKQAELELIKAKEKAQQSEYKVRSMFENTLTGFIYITASGQILEANPAAIRILGSPSFEATQQINTLTFKPLIDNGFSQEIIKCLKENKVISNETAYTSQWGKIVYLKYFLIPISYHEEVIGVWANLQDLTDLWLTQTDLKKAKEQAEESDRLKSAFLANMSHEIRTPMNGILGFAGLLKEPGLDGEEQQEYIRIIEKSGARMLNIINDIVDISKIESGQMKISFSDTDINIQTGYIYNFFKPEIEAKGMQFSYRNALTGKEAIIRSDREKIYAILTNLVKNAIKYSDHGSIDFGYILKPAVMAAHPESGAIIVAKERELEFYVSDTGIGIPVNRQKAIFDRFVQADIADKRAFQGAGLGLSITKAYVEMLGGRIWVKSAEDAGSTFYFTLPMK
jgi:hypothetical protein